MAMIIVNYAIASSSIDPSLLHPIGVVLEKYCAIFEASKLESQFCEAAKFKGGAKLQDVEPIVISTKDSIALFKIIIDVVDANNLIALVKHEEELSIINKFARYLLANTTLTRALLRAGYNILSALGMSDDSISLGKIVSGKVSIVMFTLDDLKQAGFSTDPNNLLSMMRLGWRNIVICDDETSTCYLTFKEFRGRCIAIPYANLASLSKQTKLSYAELTRFRAEQRPTMSITDALSQ